MSKLLAQGWDFSHPAKSREFCGSSLTSIININIKWSESFSEKAAKTSFSSRYGLDQKRIGDPRRINKSLKRTKSETSHRIFKSFGTFIVEKNYASDFNNSELHTIIRKPISSTHIIIFSIFTRPNWNLVLEKSPQD
ncbi:unnamed protein product [Caenorhabditis auriculariae]|uniref:Uncharacterized protein n=1 Tax=Caenorhabditis auriculariae TaxID=2777116 RepID=A0A8S1GX33_9PELO|nr:unnamed protein product [Caenorhabditis auriculariae]